jgi:myo-inositol-1(or 4)-monophosphatase
MIPSEEQLREVLYATAVDELLPRFRKTASQVKSDGSLVTEADLAAQTRISAAIKELCPEYVLVGEETPEDMQKSLFGNRDGTFWILDPLDGTTNFACGVPFFAISLALIRGRQPLLGAVYDPIRDEFFFAARDAGAKLNGSPLASKPSSVPLKHGIGIVDFKRIDPSLATRLVTAPPYASQRSFGSVALDWCWLAAGRGHVYLHGNQKVWDYAAGTLILAEAGGRAATLEGDPVFDGTYKARSAVAAVDPAVFTEWQLWLAPHARAES